jgi:hypothetical protein
MSQEQNHRIAEKLLAELGRCADAEEIAELVVFEIAGDVGALPWIGRKTGRSAVFPISFAIRVALSSESVLTSMIYL